MDYDDKMKYVKKMFGHRINERNEKYFYKFWYYVDIKDNIEECWNWTGCYFTQGYGQFKLQIDVMKVHQVAYMFSKGPIPDELQVQHLCNNRGCCNPKHLKLGTQSENIRYMISCGRSGLYGEANGLSKLTEDQVREIHKTHKDHPVLKHQQIADMFKVHRSTISYILNGKTWHHIYDEIHGKKLI